MRVKYKVNSYNNRRYSRPWLAKVESWVVGGNPKLEFMSSLDAHTVIADMAVGDIVKFGQKDYRGSNTINKFGYVDETGEIIEISAEEARGMFDKLEENSL